MEENKYGQTFFFLNVLAGRLVNVTRSSFRDMSGLVTLNLKDCFLMIFTIAHVRDMVVKEAYSVVLGG